MTRWDQLSKNLIVPIMEKMRRTILEYEVDTRAVHTDAPGLFFIVYIGANAEALDKVNASIRESFKANPMGGPAFASMVESSQHRDELARTNATYKYPRDGRSPRVIGSVRRSRGLLRALGANVRSANLPVAKSKTGTRKEKLEQPIADSLVLLYADSFESLGPPVHP